MYAYGPAPLAQQFLLNESDENSFRKAKKDAELIRPWGKYTTCITFRKQQAWQQQGEEIDYMVAIVRRPSSLHPGNVEELSNVQFNFSFLFPFVAASPGELSCCCYLDTPSP